MKILRTVDDILNFVDNAKKNGLSIGLVPTMGALHNGHKSLIDRAVSENNVVITSVFVNPTQFNNKEDLKTYPRNEKADFQLLEQAGVNAVFAPEVSEIYPNPDEQTPKYDLGYVADVMEGAMRPGHFQGVAQIVDRLFSYVRPDRAYFGRKDFQQIAVVRRMAKICGHKVEIIDCPIVRESDGLALSSRNVRLTPEQREIAPGIHRVLQDSLSFSKSHSPAETADFVITNVNALPQCEVEYYSIVNSITMADAPDWNSSDGVTGCITVYCGNVRLIDNIEYIPTARQAENN